MSTQVNLKQILVVDDEAVICRALEELLKADGHLVSTAMSASAAIELCKTSRFNLIFLDYYLPEMTGDQVLTILKRANPRQRIVLMSGGKPFPACRPGRSSHSQALHRRDHPAGRRKVRLSTQSMLLDPAVVEGLLTLRPRF